MPKVARVSKDTVVCSKGSSVIMGPGAPSVLVDGLPISVVNDKVVPHSKNEHKSATILGGLQSVMAENKAVAVVQTNSSCGGLIATGSPTVKAGEYVSAQEYQQLEEMGLTQQVPQ